MFSRLTKKFGYRLLKEAEYQKFDKADVKKRAELVAANHKLQKQVDEYEKQIWQVRLDMANLRSSLTKPIIDVNIGDPSPIDTDKRRMYVATVAGLHKDILEPKLKQMISSAHQMLEDSSNDVKYDQAIKGTIYALWEMIRWGQSMINEQLAIQTQQKPESPVDGIIK